MVINLKCLYLLSESVAVDTYIKWITRLSISQGINKVTFVFKFYFVGTFFPYWINYTPLVNDRYLVLYYKSFCIVDTINPRMWYQDMLDPDLPWFPTDTIISAIKVSNGYDLLPFPWEELVFRWYYSFFTFSQDIPDMLRITLLGYTHPIFTTVCQYNLL